MFRSRFNRGAAGQQYAIIVGLVAVVGIGAITAVGLNVKTLACSVAGKLGNAAGVDSCESGNGNSSGDSGGSGNPPTANAGRFMAFGLGTSLNLGNGSTADSNVPVLTTFAGALAPGNIVGVTNTYASTLLLTSGGAVYGFGRNSSGELATGATSSDISTPTAMANGGGYNGSNMASLSNGAQLEACGLLNTGVAVCWGYNASGMIPGTSIGSAATTPRAHVAVTNLYDVPNGRTATHIALNYYATCLVTSEGKAACIGDNWQGQLGRGHTTNSQYTSLAAVVAASSPTGGNYTGTNAAKVALNVGNSACMITTAGTVNCWGYNSNSQLGGASGGGTPSAISIGGAYTGSNMAQLKGGGSFYCGVTTGGTAVCWGRNNTGQIGNGNTSNQGAPVNVAAVNDLTAGNVAKIATSSEGACARLTSGQLRCWGSNSNGQLGNGSATGSGMLSSSPVIIAGDQPVAILAEGSNNSYFFPMIAQ